MVYPTMPVRFDIIALVNNVDAPAGEEPMVDNPFELDEENPLLKLDSIGLESDNSSQRVQINILIINNNLWSILSKIAPG